MVSHKIEKELFYLVLNIIWLMSIGEMQYKKLKKKFDWGIKEEYKQEVRKKCEWPETSEFNDNSTMDQPTNIIPELCVEYWFEKMMYIDIITQQTFFQPRSTERFESIQEGDVSKSHSKDCIGGDILQPPHMEIMKYTYTRIMHVDCQWRKLLLYSPCQKNM